jgi:protein-S-isoprenylcysteine O-methyltransferase Ste14
VRPVGLFLTLAGAALAVRSALLLAGRGRPRRGPRPALVIAGPYVRSRNPLFGGVIIALAGAGLWRDAPSLLLLAVVAFAGAHWWVTRVEEPRLGQRFGAAYRAYLRSVPRWIPRVTR